MPAGGQGAVGIELRSADRDLLELLRVLHHEPTAQRVTAERALNQHLQGGCQVPIACYAEHVPGTDRLRLRGLVGSPDGSLILRAEGEASASDAAATWNPGGRRTAGAGRRRHPGRGLWCLAPLSWLPVPRARVMNYAPRSSARALPRTACPCCELLPLPEPAAAQRQLVLELDQFRHVIFISGNAVRFGMAWIESCWPQLPAGPDWYAVGEATAACCRFTV